MVIGPREGQYSAALSGLQEGLGESESSIYYSKGRTSDKLLVLAFTALAETEELTSRLIDFL